MISNKNCHNFQLCLAYQYFLCPPPFFLSFCAQAQWETIRRVILDYSREAHTYADSQRRDASIEVFCACKVRTKKILLVLSSEFLYIRIYIENRKYQDIQF